MDRQTFPTKKLSDLAAIRTAIVFRDAPPLVDESGNVHALAIKDLVATKPLRWDELPRVSVPSRHLKDCLRMGDVVLPSRGDYYKAWLFDDGAKPVLPVGQLNIITPSTGLDAAYLTWYLNSRVAQKKISALLTGTNIKALTKKSLLDLDVELPSLAKQEQIAEIDRVTREIVNIRHRLNEINNKEAELMTMDIFLGGDWDA